MRKVHSKNTKICTIRKFPAIRYLMFLCPVVGGVVGGVAGVLIAVLVAVILVLALHIITLRRHLQERKDFPGLI